MSLYDQNGYIDVENLEEANVPFNFIIGGRGTGKTYGLLKLYLKRKTAIIYMRRTGIQTDIVSNVNYTPYKTVANDMGIDYKMSKDKPKILLVEDMPMAYFMARSTFSNIRGFDGSDAGAIVYDEFIPEKQERPLKDEANAFLNAYETANRNRELQGQPPLTVWALANSNRLDSPLLNKLGLVETLRKMCLNGQERFIDKERGIQLVYCTKSPISTAKSETALYKLVKESTYSKMALKNMFNDDVSRIGSRPLKEYRSVVVLGEIAIYMHKSKRELYLTRHINGKIEKYQETAAEIRKFKKNYSSLVNMFNLGMYVAEKLEVEIKFKEILNCFT